MNTNSPSPPSAPEAGELARLIAHYSEYQGETYKRQFAAENHAAIFSLLLKLGETEKRLAETGWLRRDMEAAALYRSAQTAIDANPNIINELSGALAHCIAFIDGALADSGRADADLELT